MSNFQEKLEKWGKEVAKECHNYAIENDGLDFYVFQSPKPTKENPDLLILGLNPGGNKSYKEQLKIRAEKGKGDRETLDDLCQEDNLYDYTNEYARENNPKITKKFSKIFSKDRMKNLLQDSVIMNRYYFNTKNGQILKQEDKKILRFCEEKTEEVITLIKPKRILTLGADNPLNINTEVLKGLLWKGEYKGVPTYRIKHPSACWYNSDCALVGEVLDKLFEVGNDEDLSDFIEKMKEKYRDYRYLNQGEILNKVASLLDGFEGELTNYEKKENVTKFFFADEILQITLHDDKTKPYFGIRHKVWGKGYQNKNETFKLKEEFREILESEEFELTKAWLGCKFIIDYANKVGEYSPVNNSTMALAIALDIIKVVTLCNEFVSQDKK